MTWNIWQRSLGHEKPFWKRERHHPKPRHFENVRLRVSSQGTRYVAWPRWRFWRATALLVRHLKPKSPVPSNRPLIEFYCFRRLLASLLQLPSADSLSSASQTQAIVFFSPIQKEMPRNKADADKPRGRINAYAFFVQTCREQHKKNHPNENVVFSEFSRKCGERWKVRSSYSTLKSQLSSSFLLNFLDNEWQRKEEVPGDGWKRQGTFWQRNEALWTSWASGQRNQSQANEGPKRSQKAPQCLLHVICLIFKLLVDHNNLCIAI